jgi:hypothetical protein
VLQELNSLMTRQSALAPSLGQRLTTREATAGYACVSPNTFDEIVRAGRMPRAKVVSGARKAWDVRVSDLAIDLLPLMTMIVASTTRGAMSMPRKLFGRNRVKGPIYSFGGGEGPRIGLPNDPTGREPITAYRAALQGQSVAHQ